MEGIVSDFVTLTCPSCGGKLQITPDMDRFACGFCGTEQIVRRAGGAVSLAPVVEGLNQVRAGVDKTASELAIKRLKDEIADIQIQVDHAKSQMDALPDPSTQNGKYIFLGGLALIGLVILIVSQNTEGAITGIVFIAFAVFMFYVAEKSHETYLTAYNTQKGALVEQYKKIEGVLTSKQSELAQHQDVVSLK
jgi:predicted RNA-binding Zn-ribbon protein involved in translation (DUF1610 family)